MTTRLWTTLFFVCFFTFLSATATAEQSSTESPQSAPSTFSTTSPEWLDLRLGVGLYGPSFSLGFATLRWEHVAWNVARGAIFAGWGGLGGWGGTGISLPFHIGNDGKNEVRMGGFFGVGAAKFEISPFYLKAECNLNADGFLICQDAKARSKGPITMVEVFYVRHLKPNIAIQTGMEMHIFLNSHMYYANDTTSNDRTFVMPHISLFLGFII